MVAFSSVFELLEERNEYLTYLPAVIFGYLYHLSKKPGFGLAAIGLAAVAAGLIKRQTFVKYHKPYNVNSKGDVPFAFSGLILVFLYLFGYLLALTAGWNNIAPPELTTSSPPDGPLQSYVGFIFEQSVVDSDIFLSILLFIMIIRIF